MSKDAGDSRIEAYIDYVKAMQRLEFEEPGFGCAPGVLGELGQALADLGTAMNRWHEDQGHLMEITEKINQGIFIRDVMDYVFDTFRPFIPYDRIGLALLEDGGKSVRAHWARSDSMNVQLEIGYVQEMAGSSLNQILLTEEPRVINDLEAYASAHPESESTRLILGEGIRSSLTCPLVAMDRPIGFLFFSSVEKGAYQNLHQRLFRRIASLLAVIVEKSRLYEDLYRLNNELLEVRRTLQHQATHDGLTGLWNRSAILELLENELARAQRGQRPAAAILIDIDKFKEINDEHGHLVGDKILREVARRLKEAARLGDTVGRYGGEEFLVVLSLPNAPGAEVAAERYRARIASNPIESDGQLYSVTVSVGVGVITDAGMIVGETLIKLADDALYGAKRSGRNCMNVKMA